MKMFDYSLRLAIESRNWSLDVKMFDYSLGLATAMDDDVFFCMYTPRFLLFLPRGKRIHKMVIYRFLDVKINMRILMLIRDVRPLHLTWRQIRSCTLLIVNSLIDPGWVTCLTQSFYSTHTVLLSQ